MAQPVRTRAPPPPFIPPTAPKLVGGALCRTTLAAAKYWRTSSPLVPRTAQPAVRARPGLEGRELLPLVLGTAQRYGQDVHVVSLCSLCSNHLYTPLIVATGGGKIKGPGTQADGHSCTSMSCHGFWAMLCCLRKQSGNTVDEACCR